MIKYKNKISLILLIVIFTIGFYHFIINYFPTKNLLKGNAHKSTLDVLKQDNKIIGKKFNNLVFVLIDALR